jgi:alkanesulfonate monooxygenase SsuD/methylene tetrahydromethanopterin reductase-like flavin-dependent oxidoreductase (luciferase family)
VSSLSVGITPWHYAADVSASALAAQAERAESLGLHSFWLPESHFSGATSNPAPLLLLAACAARTQRLRLATTSYLLPVRHPVQAAEEVAVVDCLSGGRLILGVGRGFRTALFDAFEVPRSEKRDRFETALAAMRDAWAGKPIASGDDGQPIVLAPLPVQRPHPPIWASAFGPKALAQAGRLGLPYLASPIEPWPRLLENYAAHREAVEATHGAYALDVPVMRTVFASRDLRVCARVAAGLERQAAALASAGSAVIRRAASAGLEDWALVGEPAEVADGIARYRERLGITHLVARMQLPGAGERDVMECLEHLAEIANTDS